MLTAQTNKLYYGFSQLRTTPLPRPIQEYSGLINKLIDWVDQYLCKPHPELGRTGPVCPFVPTALEKNLLMVGFFPGIDGDTPEEEMRQIVLAERDRFLNMEPKRGNAAQFKAFLLIFPNVPEPKSNAVIDSVQMHLQEDFVKKGLMVGEFHPGPPDKRGLWNQDFRPLGCPVPLIAIRHMVPTDILFLKDESTLVAAYLRLFGNMVPSKFQYMVEEAAQRFGFDLPDKEHQTSSAPKVIYLLEKNKIAYSVHRHAMQSQPIRCPHDFAEALQYDVARVSKTLFVRDLKREQYALLVYGATRQADLAKIAADMKVDRFEMASEEELRQKVGHPPFAVTPIGVEGIPTYIDQNLLRFPTILTGAGVTKMEIELSPHDLVRLSGAVTLPFAI